jgi:sirohydrochlorin ferrochelatase
MSSSVTGLLIGHGSPDPRHAAALRTLTARVAAALADQNPPISCEIAFLDHDEPRLDSWLAHCGTIHVRAVDLLLGSGHHARVDVPQALDAAPDHVAVEHLGPLGNGDWLFAVLDHLVTNTGGDTSSPVVLTAAGSTDERARADLRAVCQTWQRRRPGPVLPAAVTGADPRPGDVLASLDPATAIVVPLLLAPGALADRVVAAASVAQSRVTPTITTAEKTPRELVTHLVNLLSGAGAA